MLARIRKSLENREEGFTLIELLVVMVIIGILAAIAIPSFLAQRDKGYQSAEKSDLKTASIAEQSYATDYNGAFTADAGITNTDRHATPGRPGCQGLRQRHRRRQRCTQPPVAPRTTGYCLTPPPTKTTAIWYLDSVDDTPTSRPSRPPARDAHSSD